jgi:hypothetical protein
MQDDVTDLVDLSDDIVRDRKERMREIEWERDYVRPREREREILTVETSRSRGEPLYDERIVEREIVYDEPRRSSRVYY